MRSELLKRIVFGTLFVGTLVLSVLYYKEAFFAVFFILLVLGLKEFYAISQLSGASPILWQGLLVGVTLFSSGYLDSFFGNSFLFFILILEAAGICFWEIFRKDKNPVLNIGALFLGTLYVAFPLTLIQYLFFKDYNPYLVLSIFFFIWTNDSGAYAVGSLFGKHKLAPSVSPKKTWEGAIGGLGASLLLVFLLPQDFLPFDLPTRIGLAVVIVLFSTLGDLFQSVLKRSVNIKDSGDVLPGHGGILDRIDSMLFAIPAVFVYLGMIGEKTF